MKIEKSIMKILSITVKRDIKTEDNNYLHYRCKYCGFHDSDVCCYFTAKIPYPNFADFLAHLQTEHPFEYMLLTGGKT